MKSPIGSPAAPIATPRQDGFYLPADDGRLGRVWLPWPGGAHANLRQPIVQLAQTITSFAPGTVIAAPGTQTQARKMCGSAMEIETLAHETLRLRDTGPAFLIDGKGDRRRWIGASTVGAGAANAARPT